MHQLLRDSTKDAAASKAYEVRRNETSGRRDRNHLIACQNYPVSCVNITRIIPVFTRIGSIEKSRINGGKRRL